LGWCLQADWSWGAADIVAAPSFFRNPLLSQALAATDSYLVVFYLDGGNDGLNTIAPADNGLVGAGGLRDSYQLARATGAGGIRLPVGGAGGLLVPVNPAPPMIDANTGSQLGFHPGLLGIKDLYDQGNVAVVLGVGYPDPNLSHDESSRKWETGDPFGVLGSEGWVGRYLADTYNGNQVPAVCLRDNVPGEFAQATTGVLALRRVTDFSFPYGSGLSNAEIARLDTAFGTIHTEAAASSLAPFALTGSTGYLAHQSTQAFPSLNSDYVADRATFNQAYTNLASGTANSLREMAKVIYGVANNTYPGVVEARFFEARQGDYDTHTDQGVGTAGNRQFQLFNELASAINLFYQDIEDMQAGLGAKVTILVWSEFSRRIKQNDSGTDHGSQGPVLLIGGGVNGGVYGNFPNIDPLALTGDGNTKYSQNAGDGFRSTDLRDVYGTLLKHRFDVADPTTLLPVDSGDPDDEWTVPNFDLGFF